MIRKLTLTFMILFSSIVMSEETNLNNPTAESVYKEASSAIDLFNEFAPHCVNALLESTSQVSTFCDPVINLRPHVYNFLRETVKHGQNASEEVRMTFLSKFHLFADLDKKLVDALNYSGYSQ